MHIFPELKEPLIFPGKIAWVGIDIYGVDGAHYKLVKNNDTSSVVSRP
jgi:hypothetical protein